MRAARLMLLALVVVFTCAVPAAFGQPGQTRTASIVDFDYNPRQVTIPVGTTIDWTNTGARPHTFTDRGGTFDTGAVTPGGTASVEFTVPGHYYFFCRINPSKMNGDLVVEPGATAAPAVRVQATDPAREGDVLKFDPAELTVATGAAVVFANVGGKPHTFTADDGTFDTGVVPPGAEGGRFAGSNASVIVNKPGRYPFHCNVHPDAMKGVLTVTGRAKAGGASAPSEAPRAANVKIVDFAFQPKETSVAAGGTVTWINTGSARHTATFDDVALDTDVIAPGTDGKLVAPAQSGSYSYRCNIHPAKMRGVLVVIGQNARDPTRAETVGKAQPAGADIGGGITTLALLTGLAGAFMGGFGISAFVRNKMGA